MPFTFAHPAIVLPLKYLPKNWISLTALVVGSMIPDAEAYFRMYAEKKHSHSWTGFLLFGFPFGLLLTFVFHNVVRNPLIDHLPSFLYRRFSSVKTFNWNKRFIQNWFAVLVSLMKDTVSSVLTVNEFQPEPRLSLSSLYESWTVRPVIVQRTG